MSLLKSLRHVAQETTVGMGTAFTVTKLIKFPPSIVHEYEEPAQAMRILFCNWLLQNMHNRAMDPQFLFLTSKSWFYHSSKINMQTEYSMM
jgi:hypothetical protein